jgi:nucleotidyltransferase/DNA polymerase involved in DNA repair
VCVLFLNRENLFNLGSQIAENIREDILSKTGYASSAGVSFNKMLAKLGSGLNKPYNQTVILPSLLPECLKEVKIKKIRGFGGKINSALEKHFQIQTLGEVMNLSINKLEQALSSKEEADYVYNRARGYDIEEIKDSGKEDFKTKSIMSAKLFQTKLMAQNMEMIEVHANLVRINLKILEKKCLY